MLNKLIFIILITTFAYGKTPMTTIKKSSNDDKLYQYEQLDNGIKLLVISDENASRSAAAVDLTVGSSSDPDGFLGLAHFLEHMLFLGTDKYPDSDDYINFINNHGGNHNAYTSFENTNYFFDIDPNFLQEGLKRFSRFFVAPLLSEEYVERERNAVDSEYQSKLKEDGWRNLEVMKLAVSLKHPYSRFTIGNNDTLPSKTIRPALVDFYQNYYTPDRMSVVILGKEDTKTLMQWGKSLFSEVPVRKQVNNVINTPIFDKNSLPILLSNQTVKEEKNLSVSYYLDYQKEQDYKKHLHYISHILGYEGEGGLLSLLKQLNYVSSLYSSAGYRIGQQVNFEISVELTKQGYANKEEVLVIIFDYIKKLSTDSNGLSRYQELAQMAKNQFIYEEKQSAIRLTSDYAVRINRYPIEDILSIYSIYQGYDKFSIDNILKAMTPQNALVHISASDIKGDKISKYFNVPYTQKKLDINALPKLSDNAQKLLNKSHLPKKNSFLANDYQLKAGDSTCEEKILDNQVALYHCLDTSFNVPKSVILLALQPSKKLNIKEKIQMNLLSRVIDENIETITYDADLAGLTAELFAGEKSLILSLEGYQQKIPELIQLVLNTINQPDIVPSIFQRVKSTYHQELVNSSKESPYEQTFELLNKQTVEDASLSEEKLAIINEVTIEDLSLFAKNGLKQVAVKLFVYGNNSIEEAESIGSLISEKLTNSKIVNKWKNNKANQIKQTENILFDADHNDSAITYYLPAGEGYTERANIGLLAKVIEPKFFNELRTEKQLGYVVFAYPKPIYNKAGLAFTIQSPVANSEELQGYIEAFNQKMSEEIVSLNQQKFDELKRILIAEILQAPQKLSTAAGYVWSDILKTNSLEPSREKIAKAVEKLTLEDFINRSQSVLSQKLHISIKTKK